MSRLPLIQPETATGKSADLLSAVQKALGVTPNMTKAMANSPAVLAAYLEFSGKLAGGKLPAATRRPQDRGSTDLRRGGRPHPRWRRRHRPQGRPGGWLVRR